MEFHDGIKAEMEPEHSLSNFPAHEASEIFWILISWSVRLWNFSASIFLISDEHEEIETCEEPKLRLRRNYSEMFLQTAKWQNFIQAKAFVKSCQRRNFQQQFRTPSGEISSDLFLNFRRHCSFKAKFYKLLA